MPVLWSGPVGDGSLTASVESIEGRRDRGILSVSRVGFGESEAPLMRVEVPVDHASEFGGRPEHVRQWNSLVSDWLRNRS